MTNEHTLLKLISNIAILFNGEIHENDAVKFRAAYQSINLKTIDPNYKFPLTQKFPVAFDNFIRTVLDNLSRKAINLSFIEHNATDIGLLIHYSAFNDGKFNEATDSLYRVNEMRLDPESDPAQYKIMTDNFRNNLGKYIAQQTNVLLTEVVSFKMKNVINYFLLSFSELQSIPHFQEVKEIHFEVLQYTDEDIADYHESYTLNKSRISIGARLTYSYLDSGTLATGKLPLYNIGTLHP